MSKRWLINYLLFTLIIIFTWIGVKYPIREDQKIDRASITGLRTQDINSIRIETADDIIGLERQGGRWMLTSPIHWYANNISTERLASMAELKPASSLPRSEIDPGELGLTIPKAVVRLNEQSVLFGDTNQIGNRRYLLVEPNVYLSDDTFFPFINQGLSAFVDNRLLPSAASIQQLKSSAFSVTRQDGAWKSSDATHATQAIDELVNNWQSKQANRIKPYESKEMPLKKFTATLDNSEAIEFFVMAIKPEIIIARPDLGLQYHFADFHYYGLLEPAKPDA
jgi:hypothetical protein